MGSVVPTVDDEELAEGLVALTRQWNDTLRLLRFPVGLGLTGLVRVATPFAAPRARGLRPRRPAGGPAGAGRPRHPVDVRRRPRRPAPAASAGPCMNDLILFGRPWGFRLADVSVPVLLVARRRRPLRAD